MQNILYSLVFRALSYQVDYTGRFVCKRLQIYLYPAYLKDGQQQEIVPFKALVQIAKICIDISLHVS